MVEEEGEEEDAFPLGEEVEVAVHYPLDPYQEGEEVEVVIQKPWEEGVEVGEEVHLLLMVTAVELCLETATVATQRDWLDSNIRPD